VFGKSFMKQFVDGAVSHNRTGGEISEIVSIPPVMLRSNGSRAEPATAVRADVSENQFNARAAECAFERANHRDSGARWKRCIAIFAAGTQFEHFLLRGSPDAEVNRRAPGGVCSELINF
jgi:hypothetical protein